MAELAGSIIGIVSAGTKVALVLSQLSADIGSAGQEARMISGEIRAFCTVLRTLGETLEKIGASRHYAHCSEMITDMTAASLDLFTEILDAIQSLKNMTAGKDGKDGSFGFVTRVQWAVFKKPRVLVLRAAMESYKSNLALMLGTLDTAEKVARRTSLTNSPNNAAQNERDRSLLESLERDRAASLIDLAQAERQYAESLDPRIADSSIDIIDSTPTSGQTSHDAAAVIADPESDNLEYAARNEIHSIRLSFSRASVFGNDAIHATIIRHSQRISRMFESDENRLSPRWSLMIQEDWGTTLDNRSQKSPLLVIDQLVDIATHRLEVNVAAAGKLDAGGHIAPEFEPRIVDSYMSFLSWLLELEASQQQLVFSALKLDFTEGTALLVQGESPRAAHIDDASLTPRGESASPDNTTAATKIQQVLDLVQKQMNFQRRSTSVDNQDKQEQVVRHATAQTVGGATVDLGAQNITEFPEEAVGIMGSELARLALSQNNLSTLPDSIVNCGHLRYLNLRLNNFKTIPDVVMRLPLLEILDMSRNMLHSLPPKLFGMSKLKVLAVAKNRIRTLPVSIGDAPSLIILHVDGNPIEYPNSDQIDYRFPKRDDGGQESMTWTTNLKVTLKELHRAALNQADQFF